MKNKIELVLQFMVFTKFSGNESTFIGVYRKQKNRGWAYNVTADKDIDLLKQEFDGVEAYKPIQRNKKWWRSWDGLIAELEHYVWTEGHPVFCHADYKKPVLEAYEFQQEFLQKTWNETFGIVPDDSTS